MAKRIIFASTALVLLAGFGTSQGQAAPAEKAAPEEKAAPADSCLSAPKGAAPKGQHWYYHVDRATHRKCWYLHDLIAAQPKPAAHAATAANAKDTEDADPPPKAAATPPKPAARSRATTADASGTSDAPRQAVRQTPAPQAQSPWPSAPPKIAPVRSVPSASEPAANSAPAREASPSKSNRNEPRTADASGALPFASENPGTAAPRPGSDQSTVSPAASVWTDPPPVPKGSVVPSSAAPQSQTPAQQSTASTQTPAEQKAPVEKKDVASPDTPAAQPAAAVTSNHTVVEDTLVFTAATILAGLAFFAFMLMRQRLWALARKGLSSRRLRMIWLQTRSKFLQTRSKLSNRDRTVFRRKGMQAPLVPEQVTTPRPFFARRDQEMPRHSYEHQIK